MRTNRNEYEQEIHHHHPACPRCHDEIGDNANVRQMSGNIFVENEIFEALLQSIYSQKDKMI